LFCINAVEKIFKNKKFGEMDSLITIIVYIFCAEQNFKIFYFYKNLILAKLIATQFFYLEL